MKHPIVRTAARGCAKNLSSKIASVMMSLSLAAFPGSPALAAAGDATGAVTDDATLAAGAAANSAVEPGRAASNANEAQSSQGKATGTASGATGMDVEADTTPASSGEGAGQAAPEGASAGQAEQAQPEAPATVDEISWQAEPDFDGARLLSATATLAGAFAEGTTLDASELSDREVAGLPALPDADSGNAQSPAIVFELKALGADGSEIAGPDGKVAMAAKLAAVDGKWLDGARLMALGRDGEWSAVQKAKIAFERDASMYALTFKSEMLGTFALAVEEAAEEVAAAEAAVEQAAPAAATPEDGAADDGGKSKVVESGDAAGQDGDAVLDGGEQAGEAAIVSVLARSPKNAPLMAGAQKTLKIHSTESDGTDSDFSDGGYQLYYYEIPDSVLGISQPAWYMSYENLVSALSTKGKDAISTYRGNVAVSQQDATLSLTMEDDASADNPYYLIFVGDKVAADAVEANMPVSFPEWSSMSAFKYDGTNIEACPGTAAIAEDGTCTVGVSHDDSTVVPEFSFQTDSAQSAEAYPVTATTEFVLLLDTSTTPPSYFASTPVSTDISADGTVQVRFDDSPISLDKLNLAENPMQAMVFVSFADGDGKHVSSWQADQSIFGSTSPMGRMFNVYLASDGKFHQAIPSDDGSSYSMGEELTPKFTYDETAGGVKPKGQFRFRAAPDVFEDGELPVYAKITVTDCYDRSWTSTKIVPITAADLNKDMTVAFDDRDPYLVDGAGYSNNPLDFRVEFFDDADCTMANSSWNPSSWSWIRPDGASDTWKTEQWTVDPETGNGQYVPSPMTLYYPYVRASIPYSAFSNDGSLYPAYLKISSPGTGQDQVVELTGNGSGNVDLGKIRIDYYTSVSWTVYSDPACSEVHPGWNVENQSTDTSWYLSQDGTEALRSNPSAFINLSKITSNSVTLPIETTLGNLSESSVFPVHMSVTLHDNNGSFQDVTVQRQLDSLADANGTLTFTAHEGETISSNADIQVQVAVSSDDPAKTNAWITTPSTVMNVELQGDGKLHQGISLAKLSYKPVSVSVKPDFFKVVPGDDHPIYVKTWLLNNNECYDFREIRDNSEFTVTFPVLGCASSQTAVLSAMTEDGSESALSLNNAPFEIPTSEGTYFYSDELYGEISANGTVQESGSNVVLKPFESNKSFSSFTVPVKIHIPESGKYQFKNGTYEAAYLQLYRIDPESGGYEAITQGNSSSTNYTSAFVRVSSLGDDYEGVMNVPMRSAILPGTYYMDYALSYYSSGSSMYIGSEYNRDFAWTSRSKVKVTLKQDGSLVFEDDTPVVLDYYYNTVIPQFDVHAEYPDGSDAYDGNSYDSTLSRTDENQYTPSRFHYSLIPVSGGTNRYQDVYLRTGFSYEGSQVANIPEGDSIIGSPYQRYDYLTNLYYTYSSPELKPADYQYNGPAVIASAYDNVSSTSGAPYRSFGEMGARGYPDQNVFGYPVGDYNLSYSTGNSTSVSNKWYQVSNLKVHLAEDGKLYQINDDGSYSTTPYVMQIRYGSADASNSYESLKIKVDTTLRDGVSLERAFTAGDVFVAMVTEFRNHSNNADNRTDYYAVGTASITEAGTIDLELRKPNGDPIVLHDDACYNLSYGTFHNWSGRFDTSTPNKFWPVYDNTSSSYTYTNGYCHPDTSYPVYFTASNVDTDGSIKGFIYDEDGPAASYVQRTSEQGDTSGDMLRFNNDSLIMPWSETTPGSITQEDNDNSTVYKPITNFSQVKEKGNYIIVVKNTYDNKWYALFVDENGGNSVELEDVSSLADLEAGYKVDVSDKFNKMIFQATGVTQGSDSVSLKLRSGYKNDAGKYISMKMGNSSDVPEPLLSDSSGTVIIRNSGDKQFAITKGNYSYLWYVANLYGWSGFTTVSNKFGPKYAESHMDGEYMVYGLLNSRTQMRNDYNKCLDYWGSNPYGGNYGCLSVYAGVSEEHSRLNTLMVDVDQKYLNNTFYNKMVSANSSYPGNSGSQVYILSDDIEEPQVEQPTNKYTLVKTYGDFIQTYAGSQPSNEMLLVYTDADGKEFALDPAGLSRVESKTGGSGYRTITTVADHLLIPNNNSGTSESFGIDSTEIKEDGTYVLASQYAFRKSRQNATEDKNYLTMPESGADAWAKNDDASHDGNLVYVMHPGNTVRSLADWDATQTYKLSVVRNGTTTWLGVADDGNGGLKMTTVGSEEDAVSFKVYTNKLSRYYSSANGTDLYKYYKITKLTDINAGDELLIVYDDNGTKKIFGYPFQDSGRYTSGTPHYSYYYGSGSYAIPPAVEVLPSQSVLDTREPDSVGIESKYKYRLGTSEYIKKPFAYEDAEDDSFIWAQGIAANAVGTAKSESSKQRKYESVSPLGNMNSYVYIKDNFVESYYTQKAETNFFPGDNEGEFFIRGGKSSAWLGTTTYQRNLLSLETGNYELTGNYTAFTTVSQENRIPVQIYRRPTTDETFQIQYYTTDNELDHSETKPKESFSLTRQQDVEKDGTNYVFVGYTTDFDKAGYLSLADSANLYDYDDVAHVASIKQSAKAAYGLLDDCNPEGDNLIDYEEIDDKVVEETSGSTTTDVLKVYPVFAMRGYSSAISANDEDQMIVGASDFKDIQSGSTGAINEKERWLGSIDIEVYKDGELWVPGVGGSTIGKKLMAAPTAPPKATLYFAYHNDNAADLNIKFIADSVTQDTLYSYMSSNDFSATEPSGHYVIDAVWAEQGGSEDGLKYRYNWMDSEHGGQLDNVKGGSTVKIYITTRYQVKYYLDNDGGGYRELTGAAWQDEGYYATPGTINAVNAIDASETDYRLTTESTGDQGQLINPTPSSGATFKDEDIRRGEYQKFLYVFDDYPHEFDVAKLPGVDEIGSNLPLSSDKWAIRNADLEQTAEQAPETTWVMQGTSYGTGNTGLAFRGTAAPFAGDDVYTYHLTAEINVPKFDMPFTGRPGLYLAEIAMGLAAIATAIAIGRSRLRRDPDGDGTGGN